MAERNIKFIYNGQELIIQCKKEETTKQILQRYLTKIQKTSEDVYFLYNGAILDSETKLNEEEDSSKEKVVLVFNQGIKLDDDESKEKNFSYAKDIICPTCGDSSLITFSDYKINISSCDNGHETNNILLENFKETQKINEDEIKCSKCKKKEWILSNKNFIIAMIAKSIYVLYVKQIIIKVIKFMNMKQKNIIAINMVKK